MLLPDRRIVHNVWKDLILILELRTARYALVASFPAKALQIVANALQARFLLVDHLIVH